MVTTLRIGQSAAKILKNEKGHIYLLTSPNGNQYVGQAVCALSNGTVHGYKGRWRSHIIEAKNNQGYSRILDNAIRKYGYKNFKLELIEEISIENLNDREIYWINKLDTISPNGYNMTSGGGSNYRRCE